MFHHSYQIFGTNLPGSSESHRMFSRLECRPKHRAHEMRSWPCDTKYDQEGRNFLWYWGCWGVVFIVVCLLAEPHKLSFTTTLVWKRSTEAWLGQAVGSWTNLGTHCSHHHQRDWVTASGATSSRGTKEEKDSVALTFSNKTHCSLSTKYLIVTEDSGADMQTW